MSPLFTILIKPEKKAEPLEVLIDSGATSSFLHPRTAELLRLPLIDLPTPVTVTMLNGSSPQAGKIWKKAVLTFSFDGKKMTETFLICNTGSHAAILGLKWLDAHNPEIDWNMRTLTFPHATPKHVAIAEEEEADKNPLKEYPPSTINTPSMTDAESATLKDWLRDELKAGKIRPSKSSISSPVMFVPKKDGSRRLVVDYRRLNNCTKKNVYPLPRPDDLMAQLRGAKIFTKLDLRWGYNNVQVKEGDEWKTAFQTKYGLYESLRPNVPSITSVEYLGIIVLDKGFSLDKLKIQAVQEWPTPTRVKEVQFHMARPLHNLVKKDTPWKWELREQEAFQGLKDAITNAPVLCHADPTKPYFLETDASGALWDPYLVNVKKMAGYTHCQTMLPDPVFANIAKVTPKKEIQRLIEAALDQDESLEEILQFLQNESKAPPSIKRAFKDYQMEAGLLFYQGQIVVPDVGTLRTDLLRIFHDSPLAGHPGRQRTLELLSRNYYWPGICADTYWHVDSCETCQQIRKPKLTKGREPRLNPSHSRQLHQIWDLCQMLQKAKGTQASGVVPGTRMETPRHAREDYIQRGRVFNNKFLRALYKRLGIDPHFSLAYHPQSDRQTERVNPSIKHFLRAYSGVNQQDWAKWLPMAEFAYNNAVHSSTGKTPFKALYGWEPTLTPSNVPTDVPEADDLAQTMEAQWKEVESALRQSKQQMVAGEDGSPIEFNPKLTEQRLGLFKVVKKISNRAYRLELPSTMRIHNVFYIGLLSKVKKDDKRAFKKPTTTSHHRWEEEYKVEGITDAKERNGEWFFRVKWKGYRSEENTWEPQENLKNAKKILEKYKKEMKKKALGAAKALRGGQCRRHTQYQGINSHFLKFKQS
ncbi:hypothetical protein RHS01_06872 [Rhizoctonia solani]|uniref:Uncharacterized protein n=1 Tax=Rhizoctonia solani TaxID=456999 RepID=A0A8H7IDQ7_9AGAM|nr:hypothetical protein RHS01_06872 [Rhizoctonia solani]